MVAPYPKLDPRRAARLLEELEALAPALVPEWRGAGIRGAAGQALMRIAANTLEQATKRIDQTPRRDAIDFFNRLDIPPASPKAATAPLVFTVAEKRDSVVNAPAGVQVAGKTADGEQVLFETSSALDLTPARLQYLAAVDALADHIEEPPKGFSPLEPVDAPSASFRLASFAAAGTRQLQITPIIGLDEGDLIRLNGAVYLLGETEEGLFQLEDDLREDAEAGAAVEKVSLFETFDLRNLQAHYVYVGHKEILNLEQRSSIQLKLGPRGVASRLQDLASFHLYGTRLNEDTGEEATDWHPLIVDSVVDGTLWLVKDWFGSVDELPVNEEKCRWLRIGRPGGLTATSEPRTRTSTVKLRVKSGSPEKPPDEKAADCCPSSSSGEAGTGVQSVDTGTGPGSDDVQSDKPTISQAFHNGTPLPLATSFFPFGPEPQRFDTFALAAPESLSKKGAEVTLTFELVDATLANLELTLNPTGGARAYSIGVNGRLQLLRFDETPTAWQELNHPERSSGDNGGSDASNVAAYRLDPKSAPQSVQVLSSNFDLVAAMDVAGRLWTNYVKADGSEQRAWTQLPMPESPVNTDFVLLRNPDQQQYFAALLLVISGGQLHRLYLSGTGLPYGAWQTVAATGLVPNLGPLSRIVQVLNKDWPAPPAAFPMHVAIADEDGAIWVGEVTSNTTLTYERLDPAGTSRAALDVRPAAAEFGDSDDLIVFGADESNHGLFALTLEGSTARHIPNPDAGFTVRERTSLRCHPGIQESDAGQPVASAFGEKGGARNSALWTHADRLITQEIPEGEVRDEPDLLLLKLTDKARLILTGKAESFYFIDLEQDETNVSISRFDHALYLDDQNEAAHYARIDSPSSAIPYAVELQSAAIRDTVSVGGQDVDRRVYSVRDSDAPLQDQDQYTFFRKRDQFSGEISSGDQLEIDLADQATGPGSLVVISDANGVDIAHVVVDFDDTSIPVVATLAPPTTQAGSISYTQTEVLGAPRQVDPQDRFTLAFVSVGQASIDRTHLRLRFDSQTGADPGEQAIGLLDGAGLNNNWALLQSIWAVQPQDGIDAVFVEAIVGSEWSQIRFDRGYQNPEVSWEYFDGDSWRKLEGDLRDGTNNFAASGDLVFDVPNDLSPADVAGQEDYWIRARLVGGDYGRARYVVDTVVPDPQNDPNRSTQTVTVDTSELSPPEVLSVKASYTLTEDIAPEFVLVENNRDVLRQTAAAASGSAEFELFEGAAAIGRFGDDEDANYEIPQTRALYLGFSKTVDVSLSLYIDAVEQEGSYDLVFQVLVDGSWHRITADDETSGLLRRGFLGLKVDRKPRRSRLFGKGLYWVRMFPESDGEQWAPQLNGVYVNAGMAVQAQTIEQEIVGSSPGDPDQTYSLANQPILPESLELRVRETLTDDELEDLKQLPVDVNADTPTVADYDEQGIRGDWVRWDRVDSFVGVDGDARVFRLDPATATITFGDDSRGKIPPAGRDTIRAVRYQTGGGRSGNVAAFSVSGLKSALEGVDSVTNPIAAAGGIDAPDIDSLVATAPARIRHNGQGLSAADLEALATASSPSVVRARCIPPSTAADPIRVVIARRTGDRCPHPTLVQRDALAKSLREAGWGALDTLPSDGIRVDGPRYVRVKVRVRIIPGASQDGAEVERNAKQAVADVLHPTDGGPSGSGWPFGRRIWESDVLRALSSIDGIDRITALEIASRDGSLAHENPGIDELICAEEEDIDVRVLSDVDGGSR